METDNSEPAEKRQKLSDVRTIRVDLSGLPRWVREASDEELVKVFEMGVTVKDSIGLNVSFQDKFINDLLNDKFEPMSKTIESLAQNVSKETEGMQEQTKTTTEHFQKQVSLEVSSIGQQVKKMETSLVLAVNSAAAKVPSLDTITTQVGNVQTNVSKKVDAVTDKQIMPSLTRVERKLDDMAKMYSKATTKGVVGEAQVIDLLKELKNIGYTIEDVAKTKGPKGDIHVTSPKEDKYLIEVKKHTGTVPTRDIEKFDNDVQSSPEFKVGILLSLNSAISQRAVKRRFQIVGKRKQFLIYVPNLLSEPNLAVWSVLLADELVALNQDNLNDDKLADVTSLYQQFTSCMDRSKKCKEKLDLLKRTVKSLGENLNPLLKIVNDAKAKLNSVLHK